MKKYYRNRIMFSAILSFLIVLVIAAAGILLLSYYRLERNTDSFIASRLVPREEGDSRFMQDVPPAMFGYNPGIRNTSFRDYEIQFTPDGDMVMPERHRGTDNVDESVLEYIRNAVGKGAESGKVGSCKFGIRFNEDGSASVALIDLYPQLHTMFDILKAAGQVGIGIFILLIIVLFPVSGKMADIFVRNAEEQRRFITDAGHDLKTPVAIARANLDVLELREGQSKWSGNVRAQVDRMEHLVQDLIMMARLDEEKNEEIFGDVELSPLAEELWEEYQPSMKQKQIRGNLKLEETAPVHGAESLIRRMFCLLMDNAVQYTPEGGEVWLSVTPGKKKTRIVLANTVLSLPTEKPEKLTERFVRGDSARTQKSGGSGIGLAAAKRIAEKHHGKLIIDYHDEHTFRVTVEL